MCTSRVSPGQTRGCSTVHRQSYLLISIESGQSQWRPGGEEEDEEEEDEEDEEKTKKIDHVSMHPEYCTMSTPIAGNARDPDNTLEKKRGKTSQNR